MEVMFLLAELDDWLGLEGRITYLFCVSLVKLVRLDSLGMWFALFDTASWAACNKPPSWYASVGDARPVEWLIEL